MLEREEVEEQKQCFMCDYIGKLVTCQMFEEVLLSQGTLKIFFSPELNKIRIPQPSDTNHRLPVGGFPSSIDGFKEGGRW